MNFARVKYAIFICLLLSFQQFGEVQSNVWSRVRQGVKQGVHNMFGTDRTDSCRFGSADLMRRNGYLVEEHNIVTDDGYILTTYRCNSKKPFYGPKQPVILQHGIISSSDDFCINLPSQAPAYVFADAGHDVWLPNLRGNTYSKNHTTMTTKNPKFWDFTFTDIALHDYPAVIDYVRGHTGFDKVKYVAHSQGTTSLMVLLSEKPEYNRKVAAASLLAPVGYLGNSGHLLQALGTIAPVLSVIKNFGYFERLPFMSGLYGEACSLDMMHLCSNIINIMCGDSDHQRNETMMPAFMCHLPSGASVKQVMHFAQEVKYGFFGNYKEGSKIPPNFDLSRITTPLTLHYSPTDTFTNPKDVKRLISELRSVVFVQEVTGKHFAHMDFLWGIHAAKNIYSNVLQFFQMY